MDTKTSISELKAQLAKYHNCDESEIVGKVRDLLEEVEGFGTIVYWGCISEETLNSNF